jgi:hypothetical protein
MVTGRGGEPAPEPRRRRSGETGKAFALAAKSVVARAAGLSADAYSAAAAYLSDTLDWLGLWDANSDSNELDDDCNTKQNCSSPQL